MTPPEKVIVVLDGEKAQKWIEGDDDLLTAETYLEAQVEAALDTDRDELIERVAKAIWEGSDLNDGEEQSWVEFKAKWPYDADSLDIMARAVIAAIEGEGETNG